MALDAIAANWEAIKSSFIPHDQNFRALVHVHGAIAIYLFLACFAKRGLASPWPPAFVTGLTLLNELADLSQIGNIAQTWVYWDTGSDIFNSVIWPVLIMLVASFHQGRAKRSE